MLTTNESFEYPKEMMNEFNNNFQKEQSMKKRKNKSQLIVSTPLWLQRRMLKNLKLEARNKVRTVRARRALEILEAIHVDSMLQTEPVRKSRADAVKPISKAIPGWASLIRRFASNVFLKVRLRFIKAKTLFNLRVSKVNIKSALLNNIEMF